ncbi:hypothetical protein AB0N31_02105 [Streptomyces sp. NPDC051051]|uniref:hypothetical protein n=1 Tax=Streptomyces sp. NPDC051051 TaxID=3155666 RepID=UPI003446CB27
MNENGAVETRPQEGSAGERFPGGAGEPSAADHLPPAAAEHPVAHRRSAGADRDTADTGDRPALSAAEPLTGQDESADAGPPGDPGAPTPPASTDRPRRRGPGPFTLLVLPGPLTLSAVAGVLALTGGLPSDRTPGADGRQVTVPGIDESHVPWLRNAAVGCTVVALARPRGPNAGGPASAHPATTASQVSTA